VKTNNQRTLIQNLIAIILISIGFQHSNAQSNTVSNVALNKLASSSTYQSALLDASHAFDGDTSTRFSSGFSDSEWVSIDLGRSYLLKNIVLVWERAYGKDFNILFSNSGTFTDLFADSIQIRNNVLSNNDIAGINTLNLKKNTIARYVKLQGVYGYSLWEFKIMGSKVLPASPLDATFNGFSGIPQNNAAVLSWNSSTEFNIAGYAIEHSSDGAVFNEVGWVNAVNNGNKVTNYSYTYDQIQDRINYYRVKIINYDGDSSYSNVLVVKVAIPSTLKTYPVPVKDQISIEYTGGKGEKVSVSILNSLGFPFFKRDIIITSNQQVINIPRTNAMKPGIYIMYLTNNKDRQYTQQLVLQ
jgi:hypothetical protein